VCLLTVFLLVPSTLVKQRMTETTAPQQVQALPQELCKETVAEWNDTAGDYVRAKMFDRKQFVTDADLEMGGHIQKLVTLELHISGAERQRLFWEEHGGKATVRNTVRKKRQAAQNSMKLAFRGKLVYCCVTRCAKLFPVPLLTSSLL
jgi:hypothetical protein